jgi:KUP system potassium uptake protein
MTASSPVAVAAEDAAATSAAGSAHDGVNIGKLALGALGVVYGDIGTSPLYAVKECFAGQGMPASAANVLGILSLIFWSLTFVVSIKYLLFVMRADNHGEGGILALLALVSPADGKRCSRTRFGLLMLGLFGAALLYGDGVITPAISVLSAVEGLGVATPSLHGYVVPLTCVILALLFAVQKRGTSRVGAVFGPIMLCWFGCLAGLGVRWIVHRPEVLAALNPWYAIRFFLDHRGRGFLVLGAVVLCITGGEALYADMGHFGRRPIRLAWGLVVFPALLLNYLGQGALLLERPQALGSPFFAMADRSWLYPMVALSTVGAVIASQALISGAFSLTRQAIQLGYSPRMTIVHTSGKTEGQIYVPEVNAGLMVACLTLVLAFKESGNLAGAYGIAVTGTMAITSILFYVFARERWGWGRVQAGLLTALFLLFDLTFLAANTAKIADGGWFPLAVAAAVFTIMTTWKRGRSLLAQKMNESVVPLHAFVGELAIFKPHRVSGTAVFMTSTARGTPSVLFHHFKHNKVLHQHVVILNIVTDNVPEVPARHRIHFKSFGHGFWGVTAHYGFVETPNVLEIARLCRRAGIPMAEADTSFYLGRETLVPGPSRRMTAWRRWLFALLARNARSPTDFFGLPPNRVVELGTQIEI